MSTTARLLNSRNDVPSLADAINELKGMDLGCDEERASVETAVAMSIGIPA